MSDTLILQHLRAIRAEIAEDGAEGREQRTRLGAVDRSIPEIVRSVARVEGRRQ